MIVYTFGGRLERKYWLLIAALLNLAGGLIVTFNGTSNPDTCLEHNADGGLYRYESLSSGFTRDLRVGAEGW